MRYIALILAGFLLSAPISAEQTTQTDPRAELCMAAAESKQAMVQKAKDMGLRYRNLRGVKCNNVPLLNFAQARQELIDAMSDQSEIATVQ